MTRLLGLEKALPYLLEGKRVAPAAALDDGLIHALVREREDVVAAAREVSLNVPLVVRLEGTNVDLGKKILAESGLPIVSADDLGDAAQKVVRAVKEAQ